MLTLIERLRYAADAPSGACSWRDLLEEAAGALEQADREALARDRAIVKLSQSVFFTDTDTREIIEQAQRNTEKPHA